jgi:RimJ/RimL family protein N-acetyltransferase
VELTPIVLEGRYVRLEPLTPEHHAGLCEVGLDPELWRWTTTHIRDAAEMREYMETALAWQRAGTALPFATLDRDTGRVIGSTRFGNIDPTNLRLEIGWTWLGRAWQRTGANTEAKYLMLRHAFETLGAMRVELKTDALNARSRAAIRRLGAVEEGTLRAHMIAAGGRVRDTVYYSILAVEWPAVRAGLADKLR